MRYVLHSMAPWSRPSLAAPTRARQSQYVPARRSSSSTDTLHRLAMMIFLFLDVLAVVLGVLIYGLDPFEFVHRRIALVSVLSMGMIIVLARVLSPLRRHPRGMRSLEVVALFVYATLMTLSMGAANSPFIALYAIALLASGLLWDPWPVMVLAIVTFGFTFLQTDYLDLMDEMPLFAIVMVLLNALLPAAIAAVVIAAVRRQATCRTP